MTELVKVVDGLVIAMEYTLTVDGKVLDSSEGHEPIEFIQGVGNIVPGLERELYGMLIGDSKDVHVSARDGYGELDKDAYMDVPREQFPADIPLEVGTQLEMHDQEGHPMHATICDVGEKTIKLDFNHPLAGKKLDFSVKISGLRAATDEELEHGHVHAEGHHH